MKLCLVYAISRLRPCKKCFTITHRWEQTQQMCEMRKEIYFSPKHEIMGKSFMKVVARNIYLLEMTQFQMVNVT